MSRSIDLFIASPLPIEQVAAEIGRLAGVQLIPNPDEPSWTLEHDDLHAVLKVHSYVDDGELKLERYPYALSARVGDKTWMATAAETVLLRRVADALRQGDPAGEKFFTLLVHDLQNRDRPPSPPAAPPVDPPVEPVEPVDPAVESVDPSVESVDKAVESVDRAVAEADSVAR